MIVSILVPKYFEADVIDGNSFINSPSLVIKTGNLNYYIKNPTSKIIFTETSIRMKVIDDISITTSADLLFLPIEVDWIEIEDQSIPTRK